MPVIGPNSKLLAQLESCLDTNEKYIGPVIFEELEQVYSRLDDRVEELENELEKAKDRIEELVDKIEELEAVIDASNQAS